MSIVYNCKKRMWSISIGIKFVMPFSMLSVYIFLKFLISIETFYIKTAFTSHQLKICKVKKKKKTNF